ncbi:hypothetical protein U737_21215 [Methylomonas sp. LW13]|uniref:Uncharacterized protein n=1 Tax=Methylomonas defluvii TaxID=3045149 RepID=A0ABU4UHX2_9GAMM|nr:MULTISPECIES: hypothetical protein [unclassified Methylomonas]MDX8129079.1 hypothetical protein [Methylomonas sp. OY6]PKD38978.1 hypothetical protein CWO84_18200 [Methylomonas sp. Kb3]QBC29229.1 hypothetical protein U737_21215 [Methylomonas sp. LW13]
MDVGTAITVSKSLLELGQDIAEVVKKAQDSPDVTKRVLLYLESARAAVNALGLERQHILTDVRKCDVGELDQVNALWARLDRYLHEDNIRPQLENSIRGLYACHQAIEKEAKGIWWRKRDKQLAVKAFTNTLSELEAMLQGLSSNFYPGGSGMGVQTLVPIFELISKVREDRKFGRFQDTQVELVHEELGELAYQGVCDESHEEWFRMAGRVEALVAQLQLAFSVKITKEHASGF